LFVDGAVTEKRGGFVVTLTMKDDAGRSVGDREVPVEAASCKDVESPTVLVLAMMIAVARPPAEAGDGASPERRSTAAEVERAPRPPRRSPLAPRAPSRRVLLGAAATASRGLLPSIGVGAALRVSYQASSGVLFGLEGTWTESAMPVRAGAGEVAFRAFGPIARVGFSVVQADRFELLPLVDAQLAFVQNIPSGFQAAHHPTRSTALVGVGALARLRIASSILVEGLLDLDVVLFRDRFRIRQDDKLYSIHRPSALAGQVVLGVAYEFR
jgi:hypothetical protein